MKILRFFLLISILASCAAPKNPSRISHYFDKNNEPISKADFYRTWRNLELNQTRWDYIVQDSGWVAKLSSPRYELYELNYSPFLKKLEEMTGKKFSENTIFLLEYRFVDDLCGSNGNNYSKSDLQKTRKFLEPHKKQVEQKYQDVVYLYFFEEGIDLKNNPQSEEEFFFQDKDGFLRSALFNHPTYCGSFALVKPQGEVLVQNGENRLDFMAQHLEPAYWKQFFASKN